MTRIVSINGSPKTVGSVSGMLIGKMESFIGAKIDTYQAVKLISQGQAAEIIADILKADVLLIVFPLYVDSLPAPLIKLLTLIEQVTKTSGQPFPVVYAICNCGFYEAEHNKLALRMLRAFARRAGLYYGYGIGIGSGGLLPYMKKGPVDDVYAALRELGESVSHKNAKEREDVFVTPSIPRFLYKMCGHIGWRQMAKKNGVLKQINAKPNSL